MPCCSQPVPVTPSDIFLPPSITIRDCLDVVLSHPSTASPLPPVIFTHCLLIVLYHRVPASLPTLHGSPGAFSYYGVICRCQPISSWSPVAVTLSPPCHLSPSRCLSIIPGSCQLSPVPATLSTPHCCHPVEVIPSFFPHAPASPPLSVRSQSPLPQT